MHSLESDTPSLLLLHTLWRHSTTVTIQGESLGKLILWWVFTYCNVFLAYITNLQSNENHRWETWLTLKYNTSCLNTKGLVALSYNSNQCGNIPLWNESSSFMLNSHTWIFLVIFCFRLQHQGCESYKIILVRW